MIKTKQLMATCFFAGGKVTYENYLKYYDKVDNPTKKSSVINLSDDTVPA